MRLAAQAEAAGVFRRLNRWADYTIGDTYSDENRPLQFVAWAAGLHWLLFPPQLGCECCACESFAVI